MSRSSARRGQVEPVAALLSLAVVCAALSLYAGALDGALPGAETDTEGRAEEVAERVRADLARSGVVAPDRLDGATALAPDGSLLNATLDCRAGTWTAGPSPPRDAASAIEPVSVRVAPGRVRPCRLAVVVWQ